MQEHELAKASAIIAADKLRQAINRLVVLRTLTPDDSRQARALEQSIAEMNQALGGMDEICRVVSKASERISRLVDNL